MYIYIHIFVSIYLSIYLSICLSIYLITYLSIYLAIESGGDCLDVLNPRRAVMRPEDRDCRQTSQGVTHTPSPTF